MQPVIVAVLTLAVLSLLRLITPRVRWSRRLKQDSEIHGALPDGAEKKLWEASVVAQAERLRIHREQTRPAEHAVAWYAFVSVAVFIALAINQILTGWSAIAEMIDDGPIWIGLVAAAAINLGFSVWLSVRLIRGQATSGMAARELHYPKMVALQHATARRVAKVEYIQSRAAALSAKAERERRAKSKPDEV